MAVRYGHSRIFRHDCRSHWLCKAARLAIKSKPQSSAPSRQNKTQEDMSQTFLLLQMSFRGETYRDLAR